MGLSVQILWPEASFTNCISGLVVEYIVAIDVTRVRFPADALFYVWVVVVNGEYV